MKPESKKRLLRTALLSTVALLIGAGMGIAQLRQMQKNSATVIDKGSTQTSIAGVQLGGPFTLTDHNGATVTEKDYAGKYKLVFFGFTSCPMICPTELQKISKALNELGPGADKIQPLFITVDPERDTQAVMKNYVSLYSPRLVGLTGTKEQIDAVEKNYRVFASKAQLDSKENGGEDYTMNHSSFTYLMTPEGTLAAIYKADDTADSMAADLKSKIETN